MELWMWTIAIAMMVGGVMWGYAFGRSPRTPATTATDTPNPLESELTALKDEFASYRDEVTSHFQTTADLVHEMTNSYKAVYEHLAAGSQELCAGEVMLELDEAPRLGAGTEDTEATGGGNGSGKEASAATNEESESGTSTKSDSSKADESRTFH